MKPGIRVAIATVVTLVAACGQTPIKPAATHIQAEPAPPGAIPPPVQLAPVLPRPEPSVRPETYSVVVSRVAAQELLFALARDARLQIDIDPTLTGLVTLNAVDQTLPQLLTRIARQIDMRYEFDGQNLVVMRDAPFLRAYKIDYLSANRNVSMRSTSSTQFGAASGTAGGAGATSAGTGASSTIEVTAQNNLWESIVRNVREILRETDKIIPGTTVTPPAAAPAPASASGTPGTAPPPQQPQSTSTFQEAAAVIANSESGVLFVRATSKQHERVQEFLDQVMSGAKRQVLIEATVAEVQLNNDYQRGIDWQRLRGGGATGVGRPAFGTGSSGVEFGQTSVGTPAAISTSAFVLGGAINSLNFNFAVRLLESFGDVKVLSSPKLSVLNNQTAVLRVTRDIIYFTITPSTQPITIASGGAGVALQASFTTTPNVAAEGFMMTMLPQINDSDAIVLNVKPTIRRRIADALDPNPALLTPNLIPVFETREFDSILRLQSGEIAVLGGLMQDQVTSVDDTIPGVREIPFLGALLEQRRQTSVKTELVIFLRATVIRDPSIDGDFRAMRDQMPREGFFLKPNPSRVAPMIGPGESPR